MAVVTSSYGFLAATVTTDVVCTSTPEEIKTATSTVFAFEIDNTQNTSAVYFKAYNVGSAPSIGTTAPDLILKVPAGAVRAHVVNGGLGQTWGTGLFVACVTTGGTAGSTSPTNTVRATIWTS